MHEMTLEQQVPAGNESIDDGFLEDMDSALAGWPDAADRLHDALRKDEFQLYSQPILSLKSTRRYEMAEVLIRLREEEALLLPPGDFLPVFEHYGMMPELDRWVVRHAAQHLARGHAIPAFCINISGQTLGDLDFADDVASALKAAGVPPASLIFEVDESDVINRPGAAESFASAIKAIGCRMSLDGFARRSVSFAPLKALRLDFVKVDGSIVRNILHSEVAMSKLGAVVRVGEVIGVGVIAECVEAQNILARLRGARVGYAQGFGISQPQAIDATPQIRML